MSLFPTFISVMALIDLQHISRQEAIIVITWWFWKKILYRA